MQQSCQSCGQPLTHNNRGTEKDGSVSAEYCALCYEQGAFRQPEMTMGEMQETYVQAMAKMHIPRFIGKLFAQSQLPKLKRWSSTAE